MTTYTITTTKGSRTADTIGDALRVTVEMEGKLQSAFRPSITRNDTDESVSLELIELDGDYAISVDDAQDLLRLAGLDPHEDDADGFHWPYAPSVEEAAAAMDRWISK